MLNTGESSVAAYTTTLDIVTEMLHCSLRNGMCVVHPGAPGLDTVMLFGAYGPECDESFAQLCRSPL
ncbi:Uncharacterised protein [Mycobacterium tuberculosis]|nr:Uncharacterised protein [Mycobacterium tuberculosis]